jgi:hypothetical protein
VKDAFGAEFNGKAFCSDQAAIKTLFGQEFCALATGGRSTPCMSFFILGRCYKACTRIHTLSAPPSQEVVQGIRNRVKTHCDKLIASKNA